MVVLPIDTLAVVCVTSGNNFLDETINDWFLTAPWRLLRLTESTGWTRL